ncbi:MAG: ABC transporter permease subunit [Rhodobacteraceae bacterium]|nr:ABC transporter permease subunit [Paracoccaceae bacterium]
MIQGADTGERGGRLTFGGGARSRPVGITAGMAVSLLVYWAFANQFPFPEAISSRFAFPDAINAGEDWLKDNIRRATRAVAGVVTGFIDAIEEGLRFTPWPLVVVAAALLGLRGSGPGLAIFAAASVMFWGMVDLWNPAISTLALMGVSVAISVIFGLPLGIWCSQNDTAEAVVRPILDAMQTMPAFVYLLPAVFFFGIGTTGAAMAIIIYAMPPVVRLTNLGIRQVPAATVEVAESYGSTRMQTLVKVQIPEALPSIVLGINQTIMMALGLAVLAVFIGTGGLGAEVYSALTRLQVGRAFEAGLCIVFMAILADHLTYAMSRPKPVQRTTGPCRTTAPRVKTGIDTVWSTVDAATTRLTAIAAAALRCAIGRVNTELATRTADWLIRSRFLFISVLILLAIWVWDAYVAKLGLYPKALQFTFRQQVDSFVDWLAVEPFFVAFSKGLRAVIYLYLLNPVDSFLVGLPWFYTLAVLFVIAWDTAGGRFAGVVTAMMFLCGLAGIWAETMETMSATITAVFICVVFGLPAGILAAYSRPVDAVLRPILDTMQTMPAFVYLIPVLMLFGGNKVTAIIATVIYAIPPMIRMTVLGLRGLPDQINEVCRACGATELQALARVKLPMAGPSIMLGINQAIVMALAMQVITPLIAGEGLGKLVFTAMTLADTGAGLTSGIAIVLLAIVLDRITRAWSRNQRKALGL